MKKKYKKNKKFPLVTIITPTFNRAKFLKETIESVLNQGYPNLEFIILDDGSDDNSLEILKKFHKKIAIVSHSHIGELKTVNKGFSMAQGEIIGVVNSDDPLLPGSINEFVKYMIRYPKINVFYSDWINIDEKGREIEMITTLDYDYEFMIRTHNCLIGPGAFFKKKLLNKLKGRDVQFNYVSDYDFYLRAGLIGKFMRIPKFLATSRIHSNQKTIKGRSYEMAMEHITVINKIFSNPKLPVRIRKIKSEAYANACVAFRICRGDKLSAKILSFFISLYYSPIFYIKLFLAYRYNKIIKAVQKII